MELSIYTDGSWDSRNKSGAWAYLLVTPTNKAEDSGFSLHTTNNVMELTAILEAFIRVKHILTLPQRYYFEKITVYSDSKYCVNTLNKLDILKNNGAFGKSSKMKNKTHIKYISDLLDELNTEVYFVHIYGHAYNEYNNYVDRKALTTRINAYKQYYISRYGLIK